MTEPRADRPARPGPAADGAAEGAAPAERFAGLTERPVAEHVEVFETEHDRLQAELGTIDRV